MGNNLSVPVASSSNKELRESSPEQIAAYVRKLPTIGESSVAKNARKFIEFEVDGAMLASSTKAELKNIFKELGFTSSENLVQLLAEVRKHNNNQPQSKTCKEEVYPPEPPVEDLICSNDVKYSDTTAPGANQYQSQQGQGGVPGEGNNSGDKIGSAPLSFQEKFQEFLKSCPEAATQAQIEAAKNKLFGYGESGESDEDDTLMSPEDEAFLRSYVPPDCLIERLGGPAVMKSLYEGATGKSLPDEYLTLSSLVTTGAGGSDTSNVNGWSTLKAITQESNFQAVAAAKAENSELSTHALQELEKTLPESVRSILNNPLATLAEVEAAYEGYAAHMDQALERDSPSPTAPSTDSTKDLVPYLNNNDPDCYYSSPSAREAHIAIASLTGTGGLDAMSQEELVQKATLLKLTNDATTSFTQSNALGVGNKPGGFSKQMTASVVQMELEKRIRAKVAASGSGGNISGSSGVTIDNGGSSSSSSSSSSSTSSSSSSSSSSSRNGTTVTASSITGTGARAGPPTTASALETRGADTAPVFDTSLISRVGYQNLTGHDSNGKTWSYTGQTLHGKPHGQGTRRWTSGDVYEGQFENGKHHGKGTSTRADGSVYTGDWMGDLPHGQGRQVFLDGTEYTGSFRNGKLHGKGKYVRPDGGMYEGEYQAGMCHGSGKQTSPDGKKIMIGTWVAGQPSKLRPYKKK